MKNIYHPIYDINEIHREICDILYDLFQDERAFPTKQDILDEDPHVIPVLVEAHRLMRLAFVCSWTDPDDPYLYSDSDIDAMFDDLFDNGPAFDYTA